MGRPEKESLVPIITALRNIVRNLVNAKSELLETYADRDDVVTALSRVRVRATGIHETAERVLVRVEGDGGRRTAKRAGGARVARRGQAIDVVARVVVDVP